MSDDVGFAETFAVFSGSVGLSVSPPLSSRLKNPNSYLIDCCEIWVGDMALK